MKISFINILSILPGIICLSIGVFSGIFTDVWQKSDNVFIQIIFLFSLINVVAGVVGLALDLICKKQNKQLLNILQVFLIIISWTTFVILIPCTYLMVLLVAIFLVSH